MTDKQIIFKCDVDCIRKNTEECFELDCIKGQESILKQLKAKEQKLKKIEEFRHNYCVNCEDLLKPSHSCKGCNMVELKRIIG